MNEAYVRQWVNNGIKKEHGYWAITGTDATKCSRCGNLYKPEAGLPDTLMLHPLKDCFIIEYKVAKKKSFPFKKIGDEQRRWLGDWLEDGGRGYLGLAIIQPPKEKGQNDKWLAMYMIDWEYWLPVEQECRKYNSLSIPYVWHNRARVPEQLEIASKFRQFKMHRMEGLWRLPPYHSAIP